MKFAYHHVEAPMAHWALCLEQRWAVRITPSHLADPGDLGIAIQIVTEYGRTHLTKQKAWCESQFGPPFTGRWGPGIHILDASVVVPAFLFRDQADVEAFGHHFDPELVTELNALEN